jgi:flagellar motility protein MotE (MotC chaperone)
MTKLLTSTWMTVLLSAVMYLGATVAFWKTPAVTETNEAASPELAPKELVPSWEFANPEADQLIGELKTEKKNLEKKEQEMTELAERLQTERAELSQVSATVKKLQEDFDQNALRVQQEETTNLKKLAKTYASMSPDAVATIFAELDDSAVVKIMLFMKIDENGAILESLAKKSPADAKRAANLSERLRIATVVKTPTP